MNAFRLVFGWVFLAVLTAAGTFYRMDEIDQRVGLARFHLHEVLGIPRYTAEGATKSVMPPTGAPTGSPVAPAPAPPETASGVSTTTPPAGSGTTPVPFPSTAPVSPAPPPPVSTPAVVPPAYPPSPPGRSYVPPATSGSGSPVGMPVPPSRYTPAPSGYAPAPPATRTMPGRMSPTYETPPRPADYGEVNDRLIDLKSRAEAAESSWANIENSLRSMNQPLRPEIKTALGNLRRYTQAADRALQSGDTASARRYMDQAEKQLQLLQQYRE